MGWEELTAGHEKAPFTQQLLQDTALLPNLHCLLHICKDPPPGQPGPAVPAARRGQRGLFALPSLLPLPQEEKFSVSPRCCCPGAAPEPPLPSQLGLGGHSDLGLSPSLRSDTPRGSGRRSRRKEPPAISWQRRGKRGKGTGELGGSPETPRVSPCPLPAPGAQLGALHGTGQPRPSVSPGPQHSSQPSARCQPDSFPLL